MSTIDNNNGMNMNMGFDNIFDNTKDYGGGYSVIIDRPFNAKEIAGVVSATVVPSQYGKSVCFFMRSGFKKYIPVARDSQCTVGQRVDLTTAHVLVLQKDGDVISRIDVR